MNMASLSNAMLVDVECKIERINMIGWEELEVVLHELVMNIDSILRITDSQYLINKNTPSNQSDMMG
jgi:predicted transcriptional regulator YheO